MEDSMDEVLQTPLLQQDRSTGLLTFCQRRSVLLWIEPSLTTFLRPLIDALGENYYYLLVAYEVSKGAVDDFEDIIHLEPSGFAAGLRRWFKIIAQAGWGALDHLELEQEDGTVVVAVRDPWELQVHRSLHLENNLPFLCGKLSGIFSHQRQHSMRAHVTDIRKKNHHQVATITIKPSEATLKSELEEQLQRNGITDYQRLQYINSILQKTQDELSQANARLEMMAARDDLTGLANRRSFLATAEQALRQAQRYQRPLALMMLDIDYLKQVNDTWGHAAGDALLRAFVTVAGGCLRSTDIFARISGDEFTILLPETTLAAAGETAKKLLAAMGQYTVRVDERALRLSASIGVVALTMDDTLSSLLRRADEAMYEAKKRGRNQAVSQP